MSNHCRWLQKEMTPLVAPSASTLVMTTTIIMSMTTLMPGSMITTMTMTTTLTILEEVMIYIKRQAHGPVFKFSTFFSQTVVYDAVSDLMHN